MTSSLQATPVAHTHPDLSFVIPAFNEAGNISKTIKRVVFEAQILVGSFEITVVDNGCTDTTFDEVTSLFATCPVRALRPSQDFGKGHAIMAGLESSAGASVMTLDADLQEPLSQPAMMLEHRADGFDMVYAARTQRDDETWRKRILTRTFYVMVNIGSETHILADARDFRVMDQHVIDALCALPERNRFMKGLYR